MTKTFTWYVFPPLIDANGNVKGYGVKAKDKRAYAQALGFKTENPHASNYRIALYLRETVWPDVEQKTAEQAVRRWQKLPHWNTYANK